MTKKIRVTSRNKWIICHEWSSISGNNHLHRTKKQICRFEEKKLFGKKGTKHQAVLLKHKTYGTFLRTSSVLLALSFCQRLLNESYPSPKRFQRHSGQEMPHSESFRMFPNTRRGGCVLQSEAAREQSNRPNLKQQGASAKKKRACKKPPGSTTVENNYQGEQ